MRIKQKINLPKFHIRLGTWLTVIFVLTVLFEAFILYETLFRRAQGPEGASLAAQIPALRIDFAAVSAAKKWLDERSAPGLIPLPLDGLESAGRVNPFAQY